MFKALFFLACITIHCKSINVNELFESLPDLWCLKREALKGVYPLSDFMVSPASPMPVLYPVEGRLPPPGMAYAIICAEGGGFETVFFQNDAKGAFSHIWFEALYSDGMKEAVSHNPRGFSNKDLDRNGPKVIRIAYLFPEETVRVAYTKAEAFSRISDSYNINLSFPNFFLDCYPAIQTSSASSSESLQSSRL